MNDHLTIGGWIFLCIAWGCIISLNIFCYSKILREKKDDIVDPVSDIDEADK